MTTAGSPGSMARTRWTSSAPPMTGMRMSDTMASKRVACTSASARTPESATDASAPSSTMISARFSASAALSSTMRYLRIGDARRQAHDEAGAVAGTRRVGDVAAVTRDDAAHERQPETDPLGLGRDERLEQAPARVGVDTGS